MKTAGMIKDYQGNRAAPAPRPADLLRRLLGLLDALNRPVQHLDVQRLAGVWVPGDDLLVELDAEAGGGWRDYVAVFPSNRLLENFGVEAASGLDAVQDQEVRRE